MNGPDGRRFLWGIIRQIHSIGDFEIVECLRKDGATWFCPYVCQRDTHEAADTLDDAILVAVATKYEGPHPRSPPISDA